MNFPTRRVYRAPRRAWRHPSTCWSEPDERRNPVAAANLNTLITMHLRGCLQISFYSGATMAGTMSRITSCRRTNHYAAYFLTPGIYLRSPWPEAASFLYIRKGTSIFGHSTVSALNKKSFQTRNPEEPPEEPPKSPEERPKSPPAPPAPPPLAPPGPPSPPALSPALNFFQHFRLCRIGFRIKVVLNIPF